MRSLLPTLILLVIAFALLRRSSKKRKEAEGSRFEPKATSKWNTLNKGEDPTL